VLILRVHFSAFRLFLGHFGQFQPFLGRDFPFFDFFPTSTHGILANENPSCTIAHPKTLLKPRNWAPKVATFYFVDLGIKALVSFSPMMCEYSQTVLTGLAGPTSSTHHSSAEGGGLDTLFPSFLPLFWVAN
jgi:hypothetical protein